MKTDKLNLIQFPFSKISIGFLLGLLIAFILQPDWMFGGFLMVLGILVLCFTFFITKRKGTLFFGIATLYCSASLGVFTWVLHADLLRKNHYLHQIKSDNQLIELVLEEKLKPNDYNHRYFAQVKSIDNQSSCGTILLNINKNDYPEEPDIGLHVKVYSKIFTNRKNKNPGNFDYAKYLEKQQVYAQIYTDSTNIYFGEIEKTIGYYTYNLRKKILENLRESGFNETELSVLHALILGQQQDISPEILQDYRFAGAVHILSVSGLHVAYIYAFLSFLLLFFPNNKTGKVVKLILLLLSLWGFAFLAGMAPAIVRAVVMFSFVSVGKFLQRNTNIFHTLLASSVIILLWKPSFLFDVGFQLSYVALFFILWVHPIFTSFWKPKNKIKKYFLEILTVSFAAQIGTFPLSMYYFHQFPSLFFVTNLLILPILSIVMIYGVVITILAAFDITNFYLSKILEYGILIINEIIGFVAEFEPFVLQDVSFNMGMLIAYYLLVFSFFIWLKTPKYQNLKWVLASVLVVQSVYIVTEIQTKNSSEWIVFNQSKSTLLAERKGNAMTFFSNDSILNKYLSENYVVDNFIEKTEKEPIRNVYYFEGKTILVIDDFSVYPKGLRPDIVLLRQSPKINLERLFQEHLPETVIGDASNYKSYIELWRKSCELHQIDFHSTYEKGYFSIVNK
jgi:competence protein ComEC